MPFPVPALELLFSRFLLTHLPDPGAGLGPWLAAARPGARLLAKGTASLEAATMNPLELPATTMAELHVANLATWKQDPFAAEAFAPGELAELGAALAAMAEGRRASAPVVCRIAPVAARKA